MAEASVVSSFRQRAGRLGYSNITIRHSKTEDSYFVELTEPLVGSRITFVAPAERLGVLLSQRALKRIRKK